MAKVPYYINFNLMNSSMAIQIQHESDAWKRSLEFIEIESNYLLNRLGSVLKENSGRELLNGAETLQDRLIQIHQQVKKFQQDVNGLDNLILKVRYENGNIAKQIEPGYKHLKKAINKLEIEFNTLKKEFNDFVVDIL